MSDGLHKDKFGPPQKGWPQFDKNGKRIREDEPKTKEDKDARSNP